VSSGPALDRLDAGELAADGDRSGVIRLAVRSFRNYETAAVRLGERTTVVHGPTGAGKTNLLEAVHFALTGKSCRSSNDRDLIGFGERSAHAAVASRGDDGVVHTFESNLEVGKTKLLKVDGVPATGQLPADSDRPHVRVFMPDRLELVKGPARVRREHFDALIAVLWPARRATRQSYVRALAQRNALLGRVRAGAASGDSQAGWNYELARHGLELMTDRARTVDILAPYFSMRAAELGLPGEARLSYRPRSRAASAAELEAEFAESFAADVERGYTGHGPHRDDYRFDVAGREARRFASQGQQRLALLALILAERDALREAHGRPPLLLLDDVLSELDYERRSRLLGTLALEGQALITTAEPESAWSKAPSVSAVRIEAGNAIQ
jgi:DNA replication and repair protein RecF